MKRILALTLSGFSLLAITQASAALETITIEGVETQRILIAPPQTPLATMIRDGLRTNMNSATAGSRKHEDAQNLYYAYGARHFEPLWISSDDSGKVTFSDKAQSVITLFEQAAREGLNPADYLSQNLSLETAQSGGAQSLAALEANFSASILKYARDAYTGRLDPRQVSENIDVSPKTLDETALLTRLSSASNPAEILQDFHPKHAEFLKLRTVLGEYIDGTRTQATPLKYTSLLKVGAIDPQVATIKSRLNVQATTSADLNTFDTALLAAVKQFQTDMGLNADGVIGAATIAAMNGAAGATAADIIANMERWRWLPADLGDFYVMSNVPEYQVEVIQNGQPIWQSRTVVGSLKRQTPIFSDQIRHVVTNPYWNVPPTILKQDIMPRVSSNPGYIASQNMELMYGNQRIDPYSVNWSTANPNVFRVRQLPGPSNSLGRVKFLFPNKHDVYLHDTNSPALFKRSMRALSSGCIRVENPFGFAEALLEMDPKLQVASLENSLGGNEKWFNMDNRVPVHLTYFTIRIGEDAQLRSYSDIYGHNDTVIAMLGL